MQNFENEQRKSTVKVTRKTFASHNGIITLESETYIETIESTNIKSSSNNFKTLFNRLIKFLLTSEGLISLFDYFKEPIISTLIKVLVFLLFMLSEISST
ncbi:hypothetical protein [Empedobacter brevis]|uniref:hypothetical protein n=1 Tax=Empedobacter brevis TaxID=247 RepID=UPI00257676FA|nr:hypothetical protein [Empedobacter brevis]MDM1043196.1 hypothetical protein [Empedobacter brevis]MDM1137123.1 hypothetical protein [Empedobacter sp. R750]